MYPPANAPKLDTRLESIRKTTVAFANLFSNIPFSKFDNSGKEIDRIKVPIIYGDKEKYVKRLDVPSEQVQITLPRIEYGLTGMVYDPSRKLNQANKIVGCTSDQTTYISAPLPYNFNFEIVLYTRNIEDANQIIEYILPHFTPDYNLKLNFIPIAGITKNVPITFNGESEDQDSSGVFDSQVRSVFRTLQFTARSFVFQPPKYVVPILDAVTNINLTTNYTELTLANTGIFNTGDLIFNGKVYDRSTAKAKVVSWDSTQKILQINIIEGTFTSNTGIQLFGKPDIYTITKVNTGNSVYSTNIVPNPTTYPPVLGWEYHTTITDNT